MVKKLTSLLTKNIGLKLLALLFAIILWMVVVNVDDPKISRQFTANVVADHEEYLTDQGKCYEVVAESKSVSFTVTGKRSYLEKLSGSDFKAVANFENVENFERVPIDITAQKYSSYISISSRVRYMEITVEDILSNPFVVTVATTGDVAEGRALGVPNATPSILRVSGPESVVGLIDKAVAKVDVSGMSGDMTDNVIPTLYDVDGNEIDASELTLSSQTILVSVPILNTKEVSLSFNTSGNVPDGYEFLGVEYTPQTVMIKGEAAILNPISSITVPADVLNLTGATDDITTTVDVSSYLPADVSLVNSDDAKVEVTARVEKNETRTFKIPAKNITVNNLSDKNKVEFATDEIDVLISGLTSDLDSLDAAAITGSISVSGLTLGSQEVSLTLNLDEKYTMSATNVTIGIVEKTTGEDTAKKDTTEQGTSDSESDEKKNTESTDSEATASGKEDSKTESVTSGSATVDTSDSESDGENTVDNTEE